MGYWYFDSFAPPFDNDWSEVEDADEDEDVEVLSDLSMYFGAVVGSCRKAGSPEGIMRVTVCRRVFQWGWERGIVVKDGSLRLW